jgi:hypothetical protein
VEHCRHALSQEDAPLTNHSQKEEVAQLIDAAPTPFYRTILMTLYATGIRNAELNSKPPFGGPEYVLHYLGRYTHRVAISNHRLVAFNDGQVTFRWRDSTHNNEQKLMALSLDEFLCRFLLHLLPRGFVRIRHFGFLAGRRRSQLLPLCFAALDSVAGQTETAITTTQESSPNWLCPNCGGPMVVIERLTAVQIQLRSPPMALRIPA